MENEIEFKVNGMVLKVSTDIDLHSNLTTNNSYALNYIQTLRENGMIDVGMLQEVCRVEADGSTTELYKIDSSQEKSTSESQWGVPDTKLLLDKYEQYLAFVGPMKKFKSKKVMWTQIATDLKTILGISRTEEQCENRYKTVLKRKKKAIENNNTSGSSRKEVPYEEELTKITSHDDSIEPELLRGPAKTIYKSNIVPQEHTPKKRPRLEEKQTKSSIVDAYCRIQKEKEENRERRHKEKMEIMRALIDSLNNNKAKD